jgi:hypothetical protein
MSALTPEDKKLLERVRVAAVHDYFPDLEDEHALVALVRKLAARVEELTEALRFQDPRNATARYDEIADAFEKATGLRAPGRSYPLEMGPDTHPEDAWRAWRGFVNGWHEAWFDAALSSAPTEPKGKGETCHCNWGDVRTPLTTTDGRIVCSLCGDVWAGTNFPTGKETPPSVGNAPGGKECRNPWPCDYCDRGHESARCSCFDCDCRKCAPTTAGEAAKPICPASYFYPCSLPDGHAGDHVALSHGARLATWSNLAKP